MRSGTGRHRRPRQAPAIFVTAGAVGGALAMPLLATADAQAADAATWDRVAQCESGGVWSANSGNGFYGGLQLTQEMWDTNGGAAYASRPDLASRSQQIAVAESILAARGPDTWPSCAVNAGLKKGGGKPDVDPGTTPSPEPSSSTPSSKPSPSTPAEPSPSGSGAPSRTPEPGGTRTPEPKPSPTDPSGSGDASRTPDPSGTGRTQDPATPGGDKATDPTTPPSQGGKHRGKPSEDEGPATGTGGAGDAGRRDGEHPSRGGDAHRTDPASPGDYTVRPGDNLSAIAEDRGVSGGWPALYKANKGVIGGDPDLIHPGQRLDVTAEPSGS
ncbi:MULTISPECIES: LysM peptidoglycan-binding domain-containing protein [Streptomyces]|uniref:LysM peptidoglycan-binding domain-containing protein n=3 Tax=Streptomyces TaxID=1883 RepID=L8EFU1_STRR1|nr:MULTISPECIES: transglycosylase family protein [Streptomyces]KOG72782.1 transglycosylase [Kitasatospora aureofaciens]MYT46942.1 LysM peptidoglycan-binding domain-containing protein [Streptomyces sp. SID5471]KEF04536.1 transglycosylase [Streptomyces rimosus]KEF20119.1 transglycosylase [Streptomyces rimosus]KOT34076.1 transglycosylase [Streptomyces sp. NRRL WC-3701]